MRVIWLTIQFIFGLAVFLAALAEIASFIIEHKSFWWQIIENILSILGPANPPVAELPIGENATAPGECIRYEKRIVDLHCEDKGDPLERYLCKITIPPAERICVEYAPPGG